MDSLYVRKLLSYEPNKAVSFIKSKECKHLRDRRPLIRPRTQGLVGPEVDWSVRESDLPMEFIYLMNPGDPNAGNFAGIHGRMELPPLIPSRVRPRTGNPSFDKHEYLENSYRVPKMASTWLMTDEQVRQWTRTANALGVRFQGARGYTRPIGHKLTSAVIENIKRYLMISRLPRGRSALLRFKKLRKKVRQFDSFESDQPHIAVRSFSLSHREICRRWYDGHSHIRFSVFKERFRTPTLGFVFQNLRFVSFPETMKSTVYKLYSNRVLQPDRRANFDWSFPTPHKGSKPEIKLKFPEKPAIELAGSRPLGDYLSTLRHGYKFKVISYPDLRMEIKSILGGLSLSTSLDPGKPGRDALPGPSGSDKQIL